VTTTYAEEGEWMVVTSDGVDADGTKIARTNRYKRDGKAYPFNGPAGKGMITIKKVDDYHFESTTKLDAGGTTHSKTVISKDGKTRTQTVTGTNSKGEKLNHVIVSERM
jgi:hypothetical protein